MSTHTWAIELAALLLVVSIRGGSGEQLGLESACEASSGAAGCFARGTPDRVRDQPDVSDSAALLQVHARKVVPRGCPDGQTADIFGNCKDACPDGQKADIFGNCIGATGSKDPCREDEMKDIFGNCIPLTDNKDRATGSKDPCPEGQKADIFGNCIMADGSRVPCPEDFPLRDGKGRCMACPENELDIFGNCRGAVYPTTNAPTTKAPTTCPEGKKADIFGNCVGIVACPDGQKADIFGNCVPDVAPPPKRPCREDEQADIFGNCLKKPRRCGPRDSWSERNYGPCSVTCGAGTKKLMSETVCSNGRTTPKGYPRGGWPAHCNEGPCPPGA